MSFTYDVPVFARIRYHEPMYREHAFSAVFSKVRTCYLKKHVSVVFARDRDSTHTVMSTSAAMTPIKPMYMGS